MTKLDQNEDLPQPFSRFKKWIEAIQLIATPTLVTAAGAFVLVYFTFSESTKSIEARIQSANLKIGDANEKFGEMKSKSENAENILRSLEDKIRANQQKLSDQEVKVADMDRLRLRLQSQADEVMKMMTDKGTNSGQVTAILTAISANKGAADLVQSLESYNKTLSDHEKALDKIIDSIERVYTDAIFRNPDPAAWEKLLGDHYGSIVGPDLAEARRNSKPSTRPTSGAPNPPAR